MKNILVRISQIWRCSERVQLLLCFCAAKLQQERKETEEEVIPYKSQLQSEEQKCEEVRHKITGMKTTIAKNEQRIRELLEMVVTKGGQQKGDRQHQRQHQ